ncbi:MAG: XRE family transcriptional regulator [Gammaproteobacteria bacterium]|nr:XRE family transcriptional regulator [Gammaproteobacteria bacterium]
MKTDTEVRHVTPAGSNIFLDLGFAPKEAKQLHAAAQREIRISLALKEQLMKALADWIEEKQLKQAEAAEILMVSRPRVSDLVNRKTHLFTIDTLVGMLSRIGREVNFTIE